MSEKVTDVQCPMCGANPDKVSDTQAVCPNDGTGFELVIPPQMVDVDTLKTELQEKFASGDGEIFIINAVVDELQNRGMIGNQVVND